MNQLNMKLIEKLFQPKTSDELIISALKMYVPKGKNKKRIIIINIFCIIPTILMGISPKTQQLFLDGVDVINNSVIAVFGIVFTGYALFQAFVNDELLIRMINEPDLESTDARSKFQETNEVFTELMMLCVISIIVNVFLKLTINSLPVDFLMFKNRMYNNVMAMILIQLYLVFSVNIFFELKSFIFNTFQLFNLHAGTKIVQIIKKDKEE